MPQSATGNSNVMRAISKGKGRNKGNSQGSNAAPRGVKGAVGRDNPGVMCAEKPPASYVHAFCSAHKNEMPKG